MTHSSVTDLFDLLDQSRHLPYYRLEVRSDPFFGLFLPKLLESHCQVPICPRVIPEFPLKQNDSNRANTVDYFALSKDREHGFLVELKTDKDSYKPDQAQRLQKASEKGMKALLHGLQDKAKAAAKNAHKRKKYFHLLKALENLDLIELPDNLEAKVHPPVGKNGSSKCFDDIKIIGNPRLKVVYIQPENARNSENCIDFREFAACIKDHGDLGAMFACYLLKWVIPAGDIVK